MGFLIDASALSAFSLALGQVVWNEIVPVKKMATEAASFELIDVSRTIGVLKAGYGDDVFGVDSHAVLVWTGMVTFVRRNVESS